MHPASAKAPTSQTKVLAHRVKIVVKWTIPINHLEIRATRETRGRGWFRSCKVLRLAQVKCFLLAGPYCTAVVLVSLVFLFSGNAYEGPMLKLMLYIVGSQKQK